MAGDSFEYLRRIGPGLGFYTGGKINLLTSRVVSLGWIKRKLYICKVGILKAPNRLWQRYQLHHTLGVRNSLNGWSFPASFCWSTFQIVQPNKRLNYRFKIRKFKILKVCKLWFYYFVKGVYLKPPFTNLLPLFNHNLSTNLLAEIFLMTGFELLATDVGCNNSALRRGNAFKVMSCLLHT